MTKISINQEKCIGCGACESTAPNLFELKDGKAKAKKQPKSKDEEKKAKEAEEGCPVQAIKVS